jgi:hypothetical protein
LIAICRTLRLCGGWSSRYILRVMRKRKQYLWEVRRLGGSSAALLGTVYAPNENRALKTAIVELKIRPIDQRRLLIRKAA